MSDSESDIGELLSELVLRPDNYHAIIRACQNRDLAAATSTQVCGRTAKTKVERRSRQQSRDDRMAKLDSPDLRSDRYG